MVYSYTHLCDPNNSTSIASLLNVDKSPAGASIKQTYPASFSSYFNANLPEGQNNFNTTQCAVNVNLYPNKANSYVYMSYVGGVGTWQNAIGYFYWTNNNAPQGFAQITSPLFVLPRGASGSAGPNLSVGDTFSLPYNGTYSNVNNYNVVTSPSYAWPANVRIGLFIIPRGWNNNVLDTSIAPLFSYNVCNTNSTKQCYLTTLSPTSGGIVVGFEDTPIGFPTCDQDYNDTIVHLWNI